MLLEPTPTGNLYCPACWRRGHAPGGEAVCYGGPRPDGMRRPATDPRHPRTRCVRVPRRRSRAITDQLPLLTTG